MSEWLRTMIAGAIGGLVPMAGLFVQHWLGRREKYQDLIPERRSATCGEVRLRLLDIFEAIDTNMGEQEERASKARKMHSGLWELRDFALRNEQYLGKAVMSALLPDLAKMIVLTNELQTTERHGYAMVLPTMIGMREMIDKVNAAIAATLGPAGIDFVTSTRQEQFHSMGANEANRIIDKIVRRGKKPGNQIE